MAAAYAAKKRRTDALGRLAGAMRERAARESTLMAARDAYTSSLWALTGRALKCVRTRCRMSWRCAATMPGPTHCTGVSCVRRAASSQNGGMVDQGGRGEERWKGRRDTPPGIGFWRETTSTGYTKDTRVHPAVGEQCSRHLYAIQYRTQQPLCIHMQSTGNISRDPCQPRRPCSWRVRRPGPGGTASPTASAPWWRSGTLS